MHRIFNNACGETFSDYLTRRKMEAAKHWLSDTDMMVQAIAEKPGYSNSQNFIRYFKAFTGETSGNYRKNINEKRKKQ